MFYNTHALALCTACALHPAALAWRAIVRVLSADCKLLAVHSREALPMGLHLIATLIGAGAGGGGERLLGRLNALNDAFDNICALRRENAVRVADSARHAGSAAFFYV